MGLSRLEWAQTGDSLGLGKDMARHSRGLACVPPNSTHSPRSRKITSRWIGGSPGRAESALVATAQTKYGALAAPDQLPSRPLFRLFVMAVFAYLLESGIPNEAVSHQTEPAEVTLVVLIYIFYDLPVLWTVAYAVCIWWRLRKFALGAREVRRNSSRTQFLGLGRVAAGGHHFTHGANTGKTRRFALAASRR